MKEKKPKRDPEAELAAQVQKAETVINREPKFESTTHSDIP